MKYETTETLCVIFLIILMVTGFVISPSIAYTTDEMVTVTIKDKERIVTGSGESVSSKFLVYTDSEVLENTDSLWYWKWDSADMQNSLSNGETYNLRVYGFRIPFFSMFRNIIEVHPNN